MSVPLSFLDAASPSSTEGSSLGETLGQSLKYSSISSFLDCLPQVSTPAIYSPDPARPPLLHSDIFAFVSQFALPHSSMRKPLGRNDRVMVVLQAGPENALALLALGSYHSCAPVNASCTAPELKDDATRLKAKAILTTVDIAKRLELETLGLELDCEVILLIPRSSGPAGLFDLSLQNSNPPAIFGRPSERHGLEDISLILHTSGTSGKKKVVPYPLHTLLVGSWCVVRSWALSPSDINLNMMPLFHVGGIVRNLLAPILSGGSSIMCFGFDPNTFWTLAVQLRATWYYAAPTVHHAILASRPEGIVASRDTQIRMICNAAGGLLPSLALEVRDTFQAVVLPSYGMTECMPIATPSADYQLDRPGCSGIACGPHLSIRDPFNLETQLLSGKVGAVCVRGLPTFSGYEIPGNDTDLDTSCFTSEGWFDSGDVGYMDDDGYLYITGRSKEIINKGGEVVSPFEVEEAIVQAAKSIKTSLAFSIGHNVLQETIGIVLVSKGNLPRLSLQQLHELLRGHLHPSKWPFAIVYMDDIPKNSAGKPLRINLSKRFGIGTLTDDDPALHRHYEAMLPDNAAALSEPIPCSRVLVDATAVDVAIRTMPAVADVTLRLKNGSTDAYISCRPEFVLSRDDVLRHISTVVPGYALPHRLHIVNGPLFHGPSGDFDYDAMESGMSKSIQAITMSEQELLICDIIGEVLNMDPKMIEPTSDFFLLGGNSLLLGKLSYLIRRQTGVNVSVADLFGASTIRGISELLKKETAESDTDSIIKERRGDIGVTANSSTTAFSEDYDFEQDLEYAQTARSRGQHHPLCLIVQAIPFLFFFPLKASLTWTLLIYSLSCVHQLVSGSFWERMAALFMSIAVARGISRIVCPIVAILFKWIVIGYYRPGTYKMYSTYYLRWWIVNQSLRIAGRGIFAVHPSLTRIYYRALGAQIGNDVHLEEHSMLYECDLIRLGDGCRIDTPVVRGFRVERDGYFTLAPIRVGRKAFVNTYTYLSPGARLDDGDVYGPHASSYDEPSQRCFAAYNRTINLNPCMSLRVLVAWPIISLVVFTSYIPWILAIYVMIEQTTIGGDNLNNLESVIYWFADPTRVYYHVLARVVRALFRPLIQVAFGVAVKRAFGLNTESTAMAKPQKVLLRRYINSILLSQRALKDAFSILGTHYEVVSVIYCAMGAKIGKRVYWPGSGIYCPDPELLEIGDDVVFGSRSALITSDRLGASKIVVEKGAMIADRVVLLPGTQVGIKAVMGSGALSRRNTKYEAGSTWIGNKNGEALCFNKGVKEIDPNQDTVTPFGRAFYNNGANYRVYPYMLILVVNVFVVALSAGYWSLSAVGGAQMLRFMQIHLLRLNLFRQEWYQLGVLYGLIAVCFVIMLSTQAILALLWVILTKWLVIGRRKEGRYDWDQSSYCQRWQLHLTLSRFIYKGYGYGGVLAPLTGSAYMVWYLRALGARVGRNCGIWVGGKPGLMTEPDLVQLGDEVNLDECSVVAHINSRGRFSLNKLKIGNGSAMRAGSRLLSGASMEDNSLLCEHTLLTSGEVADEGTSYAGWPAKRLDEQASKKSMNSGKAPPRPNLTSWDSDQTVVESIKSSKASLSCPVCHEFPKESTMSECGHVFCRSCISNSLSRRSYCPLCFEPSTQSRLRRVHLSFSMPKDSGTEV